MSIVQDYEGKVCISAYVHLLIAVIKCLIRYYHPIREGRLVSATTPRNAYGAQGMTAGHANASFGLGHDVNTANAPFLQQPVYDNLTPKGAAKDYDEGGKAVKFESFSGTQDRLKALTFIQQFDAAYSGGNFTESSKIRKAATFLNKNALQWWSVLLI